ncbi:hypothetical protein N2152v2_002442 [Parachlorella kessleri]
MGVRKATKGQSIDPHLQQLVSRASEGCLEAVRASRLTSLWAGYGSIYGVEAAGEGGQEQSLVVKQVAPPAHETGVSHSRKLHSYQVEAYFYQHLAPCLAGHPTCHLPRPLLVQSSLNSTGGSMSLVLTDLRPQFPRHVGSLDLQHARAVLAWLAAFHAEFWEQPTPQEVQEEWESMGGEWRELQQAAHQIDRLLQGYQPDGSTSTQFRTLTHGDVKAENILFAPQVAGQPLQCAAYDFQYCGGGFGVKDVVYLLASSVDAAVVQQHEPALLEYYHSELVGRLGPEKGEAYTAEVMAQHYALALLDYVRFMAGWGFWGNVSWAKKKARQYLKELKL